MQDESPRSRWFKQRADECRQRAKIGAASVHEQAYLKLAAAYDALAEHTEVSETIEKKLIQPRPPNNSHASEMSGSAIDPESAENL